MRYREGEKMRLLLVAALLLVGCAKKPHVTSKPSVVVAFPRWPAVIPGVVFGFDADTLKPGQIRNLRTLAKAKCPAVVTGYASMERSGKKPDAESKAYNLALAHHRAEAVKTALWNAGCPNVRSEAVGETSEFGPVSLNRRVTIKGK